MEGGKAMKDTIPNGIKLLLSAIANLKSNPELALIQSREAQAIFKRIAKR